MPCTARTTTGCARGSSGRAGSRSTAGSRCPPARSRPLRTRSTAVVLRAAPPALLVHQHTLHDA
eukprot:1191212-Prymnesium_polylepis.1